MNTTSCRQMALALGVGLASAAAQASVTWDFTASGGTVTAGPSTYYLPTAARSYTSSGYGVQATAIADTGNTTGATSINGFLETASVSWYSGSGLAVFNRDGCTSTTTNCGAANTGDANETVAPEHAMDNDGRYESLIFNFGTAKVQLESIKVVYPDANTPDSDATILYWTKDTAPVLTNGAKKYTDLIADGWALMGANGIYNNLGGTTGATTTSLNNTGQTSSWWLIGAYNPNVSPGGDSNFPDVFKIAALSGCVVGGTSGSACSTSKVPEPGSLALVGLALVSIVSLRRRQTS